MYPIFRIKRFDILMTRRLFAAVLSLMFILSSCLIRGQEAIQTQALKTLFTLKEAQDYALENSYTVKNSVLDLEIAKKKLNETMSVGFPQIDASIDYNYFLALPTSLIPGDFFGQPGETIEVQFGTKHNVTAGVVLRQLIFDSRYFIGLQYAKLYRGISEEALVKSEQDIKASVAQTYYLILINEEAIKVVDSTLNSLRKTQSEIGAMYREGFLEETDYDQLTLTVKSAESSRNDLAAQNAVVYNLLKYQMGIPQEQPITLTQSLDDVILEIGFQALINQNFVIDNNIDYRMITMQEQMKELNLKNEKASFIPSLNGSLILQTNAQRDQFTFMNTGELWYPMSSVGASLSVPILSSGMRKARLDQAKLELEKIRNTREQVSDGLSLDLMRSRTTFTTALENYYNELENVTLSRKIYQKTLVKYNEGIATSAELTQQHNQFFEAETKYFRGTMQLLNAKIALDKVLGNL
jgi:outer membrane protein